VDSLDIRAAGEVSNCTCRKPVTEASCSKTNKWICCFQCSLVYWHAHAKVKILMKIHEKLLAYAIDHLRRGILPCNLNFRKK